MQIGKWPHLRILGSGPTFIGRVLTFVCPQSPKIAFSAQGFQAEKSYPFPQILRYLCVKTTAGHQGLIQGAFCQVWLALPILFFNN